MSLAIPGVTPKQTRKGTWPLVLRFGVTSGGVKACSHAAFENSMGHENKNLNMWSRRRMSLELHEIHGDGSSGEGMLMYSDSNHGARTRQPALRHNPTHSDYNR